jgi:hypothetical protein
MITKKRYCVSKKKRKEKMKVNILNEMFNNINRYDMHNIHSKS